MEAILFSVFELWDGLLLDGKELYFAVVFFVAMDTYDGTYTIRIYSDGRYKTSQSSMLCDL
jgi:hypothetical protein